ncbi:Hypothetical protein CRIB_553 [Romboutsia ilealis]|uniref:Uncharacterized protein n=1 Tax=Romboutsia ilealis TaxID=1115758 RepID=A0A1V1HZA9_9FIRM|nr:hypothetical protein [Romboutsia ilealis]CED93308.1 Hypothetical protein CRIB_553 [Romboutsia ilealis]
MKIKEIYNLINTILPDEGIIKSQEQMKQYYEKEIIFIFQGKKDVLVENSVLTYDWQRIFGITPKIQSMIS